MPTRPQPFWAMGWPRLAWAPTGARAGAAIVGAAGAPQEHHARGGGEVVAEDSDRPAGAHGGHAGGLCGGAGASADALQSPDRRRVGEGRAATGVAERRGRRQEATRAQRDQAGTGEGARAATHPWLATGPRPAAHRRLPSRRPTGLAVGLARKGPRYWAAVPWIRPTVVTVRDGQRFPRSDRPGPSDPTGFGRRSIWRGSIWGETATCFATRGGP